MGKLTLNETTFGDAIKDYNSTIQMKEVDAYEDKINADAVVLDKDNDGDVDPEELSELERALDEAYNVDLDLLEEAQENDYRRTPKSFSNVIVAGPAGMGKTAIIEDWADRKGVRLLTKSAMELDMGDLGGVVAIDVDGEKQVKKAKRYSLNEFDELGEFIDGKYCVLFLDEFNRAAGAVRASLLTLINSHKISDADVPGGKRFLPAFLFTVAAVNPTSYSDDIEPFDPAELGRARVIEMQYDPQFTLRYFIKQWDKKIKRYKSKNDAKKLAVAMRQLALLTHLLNHPAFHFATEEDELASRQEGSVGKGALNPRSLEQLILITDGTKQDFINKFPQFCGSSQVPMIKQIMGSYQDIDISSIVNQRGTGTTNDSKANSVFKKQSMSNSKLADYLKNNM